MNSLKHFRNKNKSKTFKNKKSKKKFKQKPHSKYKMKGGDVTNVLETPFLSMASNSDPNYIEKGIVFFTRSKGIDAFTDAGTAIFNFFGESGFEGKAYEYCKLECLQGLLEKIPDKNNQKLCNVKIDVETNNKQTIFAHGYGQLYELKNKSSNNKSDATDTKTDNII